MSFRCCIFLVAVVPGRNIKGRQSIILSVLRRQHAAAQPFPLVSLILETLRGFQTGVALPNPLVAVLTSP